MARGVNRAFLIGNLGADPEVRYTAGGTCVANFRVATSDQWRDRSSGERIERTEWHIVAAFGRLGEVVREYAGKGTRVYVEGRIQTDKWQDRSGHDRYTTKIIARDIQLLGGGRQAGQGTAEQGEGGTDDEPATTDEYDDDIPF